MVNAFILRGLVRGWLKNGIRRHGVRVYGYHGVVQKRTDNLLERNFHTIAEFREHLRFLSKGSVLSINDLVEALSNDAALPERTVVITFDDGYHNNLLAAELLAAARMPWTVFVTTGPVENQSTIWTAELSLLLMFGHCQALEAFREKWPMRTREDRELAFQRVRVHLKNASAAERRLEMDSIRTQFPNGETSRLLARWPSMGSCSWEEIRQLAASGVGIGSHGVFHELHHARQLPEVRQQELREAKRMLEGALKQACRHFAFPNGDTNVASAQEVQDSGYDAAFTTSSDTPCTSDNRWLLPRLSPPKTAERFAEQFYWRR